MIYASRGKCPVTDFQVDDWHFQAVQFLPQNMDYILNIIDGDLHYSSKHHKWVLDNSRDNHVMQCINGDYLFSTIYNGHKIWRVSRFVMSLLYNLRPNMPIKSLSRTITGPYENYLSAYKSTELDVNDKNFTIDCSAYHREIGKMSSEKGGMYFMLMDKDWPHSETMAIPQWALDMGCTIFHTSQVNTNLTNSIDKLNLDQTSLCFFPEPLISAIDDIVLVLH